MNHRHARKRGAFGVMTLVCSYAGVVDEKTLRKHTTAIAEMKALHVPDPTWKRAEE